MPSSDRRNRPVATISQVLSDARRRLQSSSTSPAVDASVLLCHVLGCPASHLVAHPERELSFGQLSRFNEALRQRLQGWPVAYITGEKEFWSLSLSVNPDVLIPRPETETLVEFVLENFPSCARLAVADIGTGSGAIACALAVERPQWNITATDASAAALRIAQLNATTNGLGNIRLLHGSWFEPLEDLAFDLIISNPPYIASNDPHLDSGDVRFEPGTALVSGEYGMDALMHLASNAGYHLEAGGWLIVEHGYDQKQAVRDCFRASGFTRILQRADLAGLPRVTAGRYGCS